MALHPRLTRASIELVKQFEGLRRTAARLESGGWTIGYGHTASAREGATVDESGAEALLLYDLDRAARLVDELTFTPLTDNQFSALVAFAFSVGNYAFRGSEVLKRVNEGAYLQAAAEIEQWRRADFRGDSLVVDALVRRRAAEKLLFLTPGEGFRPVPSAVVTPRFDDRAAELRARSDGLAGAVELKTSLEGEAAVSERDDQASPVIVAAQELSRRLERLAAEPEPAPLPEPEVEPEVEDEPPPPPLLSPAMLAPPVGSFGRKPAAASPLLPPGPALTAAERFAQIRGPLEIGAGLVGALMFVAALFGIVYGQASILNLAVGLVGVVLMAPAAQHLVSRLFDRLSDPR